MGGTDDKKSLLFGKYKIGRLLGQGNFAKVYQAKNLKTNEDVAIKMLDKVKIVEKGLEPQLKREIEVLRRVKHPYIVQLYEVMATKSKVYIVMEFVKGGELFNKVAKGRLPEDVARKYIQQLISAVAFCHERGVYHRDIKPENLLVDDNGDLKVSDFGLSAVADQIRQDGLFHTLCGTPAYVAPEVLARKGYNGGQADLWSCGVVLFVLMAGYLPFRDHQMISLFRKIYRADFRCPSWFSPELVRLVCAILQPNYKKRITIQGIMQNHWFKKDFKQINFYVEDNKFYSYDKVEEPAPESPQSELYSDNESPDNSMHGSAPHMALKRVKGGLTTSASSPSLMETYENGAGIKRVPSLNAFDIISFSSGFNLSGLFEDQGEETRLVSCAPVSQIISKLEEIGNAVNFTVRVKDCQVNLDAVIRGGHNAYKGPLSISAEISELTPKLVVIEVKKKLGNADEYAKFCDRELKPRLNSLLFDSTSQESSESDTDEVRTI